MTSIDIFLDNAPKSLIHMVYQKNQPQGSGLVSNSKIIKGVRDKLLSPDFIESQWDKLNETQQKILVNIYVAGKEGRSLADLTWCVSPAEQFLLKHTLNELCWNLLIFRSTEDKSHFFGFSDFRKFVLQKISFVQEPVKGLRKSYRERLDLHLIATASFLFTHPMPISQSGEVNKRFFSQMQARLKLDHPLIEENDSREEELQLLLNYLAKHQFVQQNSDQLVLRLNSFFALEKNGYPKPSEWVIQHLIEWDEEVITVLQEKLKEGSSLEDFSTLFSSFTRYQGGKLEHWHQLSPLIKWFWWSGKLQLHIEDSLLTGISAQDSISNVDMPVYFLPNFEVHLPLGSDFQSASLLEFAGECLREDQLCTYKISADSINNLLTSGYPTDVLKKNLAEYTLPANVNEALQQWIFTHEGARLCDVFFLELDDPKIITQIKELPQYGDWKVHEVPGVGFVLPKNLKSDVVEVVQTFGFHLTEFKPEPVLKSYSTPKLKEERRTPAAIPDYIEKEPVQMDLRIGELGKYGGGLQELSFNERLRVIEYAILTDGRLEILMIDSRQAFIITPKELNNVTDPISIDGKVFPSGEFRSVAVENIKKIRVMD